MFSAPYTLRPTQSPEFQTQENIFKQKKTCQAKLVKCQVQLLIELHIPFQIGDLIGETSSENRSKQTYSVHDTTRSMYKRQSENPKAVEVQVVTKMQFGLSLTYNYRIPAHIWVEITSTESRTYVPSFQYPEFT